MKKILFILLVLSTSLLSVASFAQDKALKIGYTNANYIFSLSPRSKEIESDLKTRSIQLKKEIEKKEEEFRAKYEDYDKNKGNMSTAIRQSKEDELRSAEQNIMNLRQNAEQEIKTKSDELIAPESDRIAKAIKEVATENSFTYVLNGDPQIMLYGAESLNITDLVLKKLGITPPVPGSETKPNATDATEKAKPIMANPGSKKPSTSPKKK
jgi:outer membrane protein